MPDIATALIRLADAIIQRGQLKKAEIIDPYIIGTGADFPTTAQAITTGTEYMNDVKCFYIGVSVRSMGTATYIAVGKRGSAQSRLVGALAYQEFEAPKNAYILMNEIYIVADQADAVVEITGVRVPDE